MCFLLHFVLWHSEPFYLERKLFGENLLLCCFSGQKSETQDQQSQQQDAGKINWRNREINMQINK